jgi:hypothetical protein
MFRLPTEVRLIIYHYTLVYDHPIPFSTVTKFDTSLLRTCNLTRRECTPIYYQSNVFYDDIPASISSFYPTKHLSPWIGLVRHFTIKLNIRERNFIDQIWDLTEFQQTLSWTVDQYLSCLSGLQTLSVRLILPHNCAYHHSQEQEVLCRILTMSFMEICETLRDQVGSSIQLNIAYPSTTSHQLSLAQVSAGNQWDGGLNLSPLFILN